MRTWRPFITAHAISRYLERAYGVPVIGAIVEGGAGNARRMLRASNLTKQEIVDAMWPTHMQLDSDPGGCFALKRGDLRLVVRDGALVTVLFGVWNPRGIAEELQIS
jgi:hypothetical protein